MLLECKDNKESTDLSSYIDSIPNNEIRNNIIETNYVEQPDMSNNDGFCLLTLEPTSNCITDNCSNCNIFQDYNQSKVLKFEQLNKSGLISFIEEYDSYVQKIIDENEFIVKEQLMRTSEFLNNDFKEIEDIGWCIQEYDYSQQADKIIESVKSNIINHDEEISYNELELRDSICEILMYNDGYIET